MTKSVAIRRALPGDATGLTRLAIRSKAYWGYSVEFIAACVDELSVTSVDITNHDNYYAVAEIDQEVVGFYALEKLSGVEIELGALFVDPEHIGSGIGKTLIDSAKHQAAGLGARRLKIQGDPNAEKFYQAAGAVSCGAKESGSIPGRFLPWYQISLEDITAA